MSILAYVGLPGSGKSYNVVAHQVVPALRAGRVVVTNIPLHLELIKELFPLADVRDFPVEKISAEPECIDEFVPAGCVLIIDELWRLFPAGQTVKNVPEQFKSLLAEHRHRVDKEGRSTQIVFVTQDLAQVAAFARQLVEQTFLHTKLGHLGASGSFRVRVFQGAVTGANPGKGSEIRMILGRYQPEVYRLYKSHTMSESGTAGADESAIDGRANIWRRPGIWVAAVICLIGAVWAVFALKGVFGSDSVLVSESASTLGFASGSSSSSTSSDFVPSTRLAQPVVVAQTLSCIKLSFSTGRTSCECRDRYSGKLLLLGHECSSHMRETVGGWGGPSSREENIRQLNASGSASVVSPQS